MRLHRVYADIELQPGQTARLPAVPSRHLVQVLRLRAGDRLQVFNGDGHDYSAEIIATSKAGTEILVLNRGETEAECTLRLHLAIGISKGERMDHVIQKAVELGIHSITPLFTERCVVRLQGERLEKRLAHWQGILIGACEQSGRRRLPRLLPATGLNDWLPTTLSGVLLDHRAEQTLPQLPAPSGDFTLLVGPEGGLAPGEREQAQAAGLTPVRLGPRVMRTETAPLAALAAIQVLWGDMG